MKCELAGGGSAYTPFSPPRCATPAARAVDLHSDFLSVRNVVKGVNSSAGV